jgi:hypothetical protein
MPFQPTERGGRYPHLPKDHPTVPWSHFQSSSKNTTEYASATHQTIRSQSSENPEISILGAHDEEQATMIDWFYFFIS